MTSIFKTNLPLREKDDVNPAISTPLRQAEAKMGMRDFADWLRGDRAPIV